MWSRLKLIGLALVTIGSCLQGQQIRICLTGSTERVIVAYGEAFINGAKLALDAQSTKNFSIESHFYDPTALAAEKAALDMVRHGCAAIVGFSTENDVAAASEVIARSGITTISLYGELVGSVRQVKNILSLEPPAEILSNALLKYIDSHFGSALKRVLVVTSADRMSLVAFRDSLFTGLRKRNVNFDGVDIVERALNPGLVVQTFLRHGAVYDAIFLLNRSMAAAQVANAITKHFPGKLPVLFGTKNLGTAQLPAFSDRLERKDKIKLYLARHSVIEDPSSEFRTFVKSYHERFKKEPMGISALAYDAIRFLVGAVPLGRRNAKITSEELYRLASKHSYAGVTGIKISPGLKVKYTRSFIVQVDKSGYQTVERVAP